jgi:hypothetical protein
MRGGWRPSWADQAPILSDTEGFSPGLHFLRGVHHLRERGTVQLATKASTLAPQRAAAMVLATVSKRKDRYNALECATVLKLENGENDQVALAICNYLLLLSPLAADNVARNHWDALIDCGSQNLVSLQSLEAADGPPNIPRLNARRSEQQSNWESLKLRIALLPFRPGPTSILHG